MAKLIFSIWLTFSVGVLFSQTMTISQVRDLFFKAGFDPSISVILYNQLSTCNVSNPLYKAYKGVSEAMKAQTKINIYKKYKLFISGRDTLEKALKESPGNYEIRFIRFQFQSNIPSFLGYNNMAVDKKFLLYNAKSYFSSCEDKNFSDKLFTVLSRSKFFSEKEQKEIMLISLTGMVFNN